MRTPEAWRSLKETDHQAPGSVATTVEYDAMHYKADAAMHQVKHKGN